MTDSKDALIKNVQTALTDCSYVVEVQPKGATLPPLHSASTKDDTKRLGHGSLGSPRTPRVTPRTPPDTPRNNFENDERMIRTRHTEFFVYDLMMQINYGNIIDMKNAFAECGGGVSMVEFVRIMKNCINYEGEDESKFILRLCDLFAEIDIDGDKELTWEEFTSYMIKSGVQPFDPSTSMKRYQPVELGHETPPLYSVAKIRYFPSLDKVVVCDHNKDKAVRIFKPETINRQKEYIPFRELKGHTGALLECEYIHSKKFLVTSGADLQMIFWDVEANFRIRKEVQTNYPQICMVWSQNHSTLFTGDTRGDISCWNVEFFKVTHILKGHTDMITSMVLIPNTPLLASASCDGLILTWDINNHTKQRELRGHVNGVFSLAYSHEHRFLLSGGSDRDILVWNPMVKSKPIFRLKAHHGSVVAVTVIEGTPQIISADTDGIFKLWDIRTFECVQIFHSPAIVKGSNELLTFCTTGIHNQIIAGGNRMILFEYDKPGTPWLTMDTRVELCLFHDESSTILTAGGDTIKIWDAKTGRLLRVYPSLCDVTANESITAVCFDSGQKKIFVGDTEGRIKVLNYSNGALLRALDSHQSLVSQLIYCNETKAVISASWDNTINIHDELDSANKGRSVVRSMSGHKKDVTTAAYASNLALVAAGTAEGMVWMWDFEKCQFESKLDHNAVVKCQVGEITSIAFLNPYPLLCSADAAGNLLFWSVKPHPHRYHLQFQAVNRDKRGNPKAICCIAWHQDLQCLITGDEEGYVGRWDLGNVFKEMWAWVMPVLASKAALRKTEGNNSRRNTLSFPKTPSQAEPPPTPSTELPAASIPELVPHRWFAHYASITCLSLINRPPSFITASADKRVRVWSFSGEYYGTLRQAAQGGHWRFPLDETPKLEREKLKVQEVLSLLDKTESKLRKKQVVKPQTAPAAFGVQSLLGPTSFSLRPKSKSRPVTARTPKPKFSVNRFYESTRSRIRAGDPNINKFNPSKDSTGSADGM